MQGYDTGQFNAIIRNRRNITPTLFIKGKQIPNEIVWEILENGNYAPNHKKTEPWRFTVFTGKGLEEFSQLQVKLYTEQAGDNLKEITLKKLQDLPLMASHIIALGMKRTPENKIREIEEIEATACAIQNIFLSATAYGLGAFWTSGGITYYESAKEHFDLGPEDHLLGFMYLGYVESHPGKGYNRGDIKEKVKWVEA